MTARRPPRSRSLALTRELLSRPALNGGWDKLARQQDEQCARLERLENGFAEVEPRIAQLTSRFDKLDRWGRWVLGAAGTVVLSVLGRLVYDLLSHVSVVVR